MNQDIKRFIPGCINAPGVTTLTQAKEVLEQAIEMGDFTPADLRQCKKALKRVLEAEREVTAIVLPM